MTESPRTFEESADRDGTSSSFNFRSFVAIARRRWPVVLAVVAAFVVASIWWTSKQVRLYRAWATVRIQEAPAPIVGVQTPTFRDYRIDPIQSEQQLIRSHAIGERVARAMGYRLRITNPQQLWRSRFFGHTPPEVDSSAVEGEYVVRLAPSTYTLEVGGRAVASATYGVPISGPGFRFTVPARPAIDQDEVVLELISVDAAAAEVRGMTGTRRVPETNVIEISFTGYDPEYVKLTADAIMYEFEAFAREARRQQASTQTKFIWEQIRNQEQLLSAAQDALKSFKQRAKVSDIGAEQAAMIAGITELERKKDDAVVEQRVYRDVVGQLTAADTATEELHKLAATGAVRENSNLANLYDKWFEQTQQKQALVGTRTELSRDVMVIDSMIALTKQEIQDASGLYLRGLQSRINSLDSTIAGLRRDMGRYPDLAAQEAMLVANVEMAQNIYEQLQTEYHKSRITENSEAGYVRPIDEAQWPRIPIAPRRRTIVLTFALLGVLLGVGAAVGMERLDDTIKSADEIRDRFGLGLLGTIPSIRALGGGRKHADGSRLVTHLDPRSPVAEAYRSLRTNLAFSRAHAPPKTIVFTSPGPSDGKSTTVANLAITFAQQGQRTLIIDADLRRAVLDNLFNVPRAPGLTDVLVGRQTLPDATHPSGIDNLDVLGSGPFPSNPSELLGSTAMRDLLLEAMTKYDMVLLDSPPLLAVTDAAVLSTLADAAVLVVRVGETSRAAVRRATGQLQTVRGHLVGAVLNDVNFSSGLYEGGYGYYYYAYYGAEANGNGGAPKGVVNRLKNFVARTPSKH